MRANKISFPQHFFEKMCQFGLLIVKIEKFLGKFKKFFTKLVTLMWESLCLSSEDRCFLGLLQVHATYLVGTRFSFSVSEVTSESG